MHIAMFHGYFLNGTGSNLFVRNLCKELCKAGHHVSLFCQERSPTDIDFIENAFEFNSGNSHYILKHHKETPYEGKCFLYRPNLNGFLPVFVYDNYEGYSVKEFINCSREEIENYIDNNKNAIDCVFNIHTPDFAISNHTVMQPVYVSRSCLGRDCPLHVMVVHGSCLNFSVRPSEQIKGYALESISQSDRIVFLSQFSREEFCDFFINYPHIGEKSSVIPGGVDLDYFTPISADENKQERIDSLIEDLIQYESVQGSVVNQSEKDWKFDGNIVAKLQNIDFEKEKIILYFGKYLWTKGVQILIAAVPLILRENPDTRFILVGFGSAREYLEAMVEALQGGNREDYISLLQHPECFDNTADPGTLLYFRSLVSQLKEDSFAETYFGAAKGRIRNRIIFTGFLKHEYLRKLLPCADIITAPSIFAEAFGLVAVEALGSGVIPIQTNHSGFAEVIQKYADEFEDLFGREIMRSLDLNENLVYNLAGILNFFLCRYYQMNLQERQDIRERARNLSLNNYSWTSIANQYIVLAETVSS